MIVDGLQFGTNEQRIKSRETESNEAVTYICR